MAPPFKTIVNIVAVIFVLLWLLQAFGLLVVLVASRCDRCHFRTKKKKP
jgi:hypothetical protein